ncbi:hypothetical protein GCM10010398_31070 [Streptomyces fimbriatus]
MIDNRGARGNYLFRTINKLGPAQGLCTCPKAWPSSPPLQRPAREPCGVDTDLVLQQRFVS